MADRSPGSGQEFDLFRIEPYAMGCNHVPVEKPDRMEVLGRWHACSGCDVFDFLPGFCDMNLKKSTVPVCQLFGLLESGLGTGIWGMYTNGRVNDRVSLPFSDQSFTSGKTFVYRLKARCCKVDHRFSHNSPDTGIFSLLGYDIFEKIHVVETGRTRFDHFDKSQPGSDSDIFRSHQPGFCRKDVSGKPFMQRKIICKAP